MKQQEPLYPPFDEIMQKCKTKMEQKFCDYGNSWVNYIDWQFWMKRLQGEIDEIWNTTKPNQFKKEIIDAINVLAMMYDNAEEWNVLHNTIATESHS